MEKNKKRRLTASAVPHDSTVNTSLQHSRVVHSPGQTIAFPSHVSITALPVDTLPLTSSGSLSCGNVSSEMDNPSRTSHLVQKRKTKKRYMTNTANTVSSENIHCHPSADLGNLLDAINSESFTQAVALLRSENAFTQEGLNQALISACGRGHKLLVQTLVRAGANIEHRDEHGNTPLLICAKNGFTDIVQFLVSRYANVNAVNSVGNTALILSVSAAGSTHLTKFLLEQQDVDIHHENQHGDTALIKATQLLDVDTMILLLQKYNSSDWEPGNSFITRHNKEYSFFKSTVQETKHKVTATATGLGHVFEILTEHLITRTSPLELAIKDGDTRSLDIFLDCQFSSKEKKKDYIDSALMYMFKESRPTAVKRYTLTDLKIIRKLLQYGANVNQGYGPKLISLAVESGNLQLVELLCTHGADVKRHYSSDQDPMCIAAKNDQMDLIELLLKYQADVNSFNYSDSPLDYALRNGHTDSAKLLIQHGAKMDVEYALISAVDHQKPCYMNFLLTNYGPDVTDYFSQKPTEARNLLTSAVEKGNLEIIGHILDACVDVNEVDSRGQTPLMSSKNGEVAEFLIQRGADVNKEIADRKSSETALTYVINNRRLRKASTVELCKVLISSGAAVNHGNGEDKTPLMMAVSPEDCVIMLQMLLDNGADVNDKDREGNTPLMHAVLSEISKNVTCLIDFAGDKKSLINIQNNEGLTPLILSVQKGSFQLVKELIDKGADVNIKDNRENTALHHLLSTSCLWSSDKILNSLLEAGSHVNCQNSDGLSPLMLATRTRVSSLISPLLDAGADINAVSSKNNSQTALSFLPNSNFYTGRETLLCIEILLDRGASGSYLSHECLHNLICDNHANIICKLIQHGVGPAEVESSKLHSRMRSAGELSTVSPLCLALLAGHVPLARYFVDALFLTSSDLCMIASNKAMERLIQQERLEDSLNFLHELSSQPMTLVKLCLVTVSAAVGSSPGREARVDSLPLPQMMKDRLLFKSVAGEHAALAEMPSKLNTVRDSTGLIDQEILQYVDSDDDDDDYDYYDDDDDYNFNASGGSDDDVYYDSDD